MRLTHFTDYALRVLLHAANQNGALVTIDETADLYDISRAHLKKVVLALVRAGFLKGTRGRHGGFALARAPADIRLGDVVRATEPDFALVECFQDGNHCLITRGCSLPGVLNDALAAFMQVLDRSTLADVMVKPRYFDLPVTSPQPRRGPALPEPMQSDPAP
jgi:Rrf2 family nitric oxide-sensitive transcriptional repressor